MPMGKQGSGEPVVLLRSLKVAFFFNLQVAESNFRKLKLGKAKKLQDSNLQKLENV